MKVLFDTNVIIDAIAERYSDYDYSQKLINKVVDGEIDGYICSKQITDIYYILRKYFDEKRRRLIIKSILETFKVIPLLPSYLSYCINSKIDDYEDSIIDEVASVNMIDFILTNNINDFSNSKAVIISPKELYTLKSVGV